MTGAGGALASWVGLGRLLSQEKGVVVTREVWQWLQPADMVEQKIV